MMQTCYSSWWILLLPVLCFASHYLPCGQRFSGGFLLIIRPIFCLLPTICLVVYLVRNSFAMLFQFICLMATFFQLFGLLATFCHYLPCWQSFSNYLPCWRFSNFFSLGGNVLPNLGGNVLPIICCLSKFLPCWPIICLVGNFPIILAVVATFFQLFAVFPNYLPCWQQFPNYLPCWQRFSN